jgi:hypothetical protein
MGITKALGIISLAYSIVASREIPIYDSRAVISLQQTLALYPLAIDSKNFAAMDQVFAQDVVANYSAPIGVLNGLPTVISVLESSLAPVLTQHVLATFSVSDLKEESASTVSSKASLLRVRNKFDLTTRLRILRRIISEKAFMKVRFITHTGSMLMNGL